ncbi:phosphatidylinositol-specific phospholipase C/glycerophosphodiester phosphodiesterase family protein [Streptomyces sp. NPDC054784]
MTPLLTRRRALTALGAAFAGTVVLPAQAWAADGTRQGPRPLVRAHAHNDYEHARPLLDALDHRFGSVEADVHLVGGQLLVGHDSGDPDSTLEALYLDPLAARVEANGGAVYAGYDTSLQLLVDLKTEGAATYRELDRRLAAYPQLFTTYRDGEVVRGPVTVVVSGDRAARGPMEEQTERRAFYDGRLTDLGSAAPSSLIALISDNWTQHFGWNGSGAFPEAERAKLRDIVATAHGRGQTVRFWATPDTAGAARDALWAELVAADVDFLNSDDLAGLEAFLDAHDPERG